MAAKWIKRLHIYVGLLNSTILAVFALVGLAASFLPHSPPASRPAPEVRRVPFEVPGGADDQEVARRVYETLRLPLTRPPAAFNIRRDDGGRLRVHLPTPARLYRVTVLEDESRLRVETVSFDIWHYLARLHTITPARGHPDWRIRAWAFYIEFALWSLIFMAATGIWLWLASRPRLKWAQVSFAAGAVAFLTAFLVGR